MTPTRREGVCASRPDPRQADGGLAENGPTMARLSLIFLAGGLGCVLRYGVAGWVQRLGGGSFPLGTLVVNVAGCLALGFLASLFTGPVLLRDEYRLAIVVGLLGGFTTFSTFGYETVRLADSGQFGLAALNLILSNSAGLVAAWLGARFAVALYGP